MKFEEILEECYRKNYKRFVGYASKRLAKNHAVAEEAVQEGFLKALVYRDKWKGDVEIFYWLRRIIDNTAKDMASKERAYGALDVDLEESPESLAIKKEVIDKVIDNYVGTDLQKNVLRLRFLEGMSPKDIPYFLDVTRGSVRVICHNFVKSVDEKA